MTLVEKIKELCALREETIASLERKMDFGNGTIRKWDNTTPSGDKLAKVADFFCVSVDYLLGRESGQKEDFGPAFFRLKQGIEPHHLTDEDADFLATVFRAHIEKNR